MGGSRTLVWLETGKKKEGIAKTIKQNNTPPLNRKKKEQWYARERA